LHEGTLTLRSAGLNQGSSFTVRLQRAGPRIEIPNR